MRFLSFLCCLLRSFAKLVMHRVINWRYKIVQNKWIANLVFQFQKFYNPLIQSRYNVNQRSSCRCRFRISPFAYALLMTRFQFLKPRPSQSSRVSYLSIQRAFWFHSMSWIVTWSSLLQLLVIWSSCDSPQDYVKFIMELTSLSMMWAFSNLLVHHPC